MKENPYRLFFPLGILSLLWGVLLWVPLLWNSGSNYPIMAHRYLMLNGFSASFIGGFLMTAVPRFSKTSTATIFEILIYFFITVFGLAFAFLENEIGVYTFSFLQAALLLVFLLRRIFKRKENPPFSFIFIFVGIGLWMVSAFMSIFMMSDAFKNLHYEGAITAIILGVGSRLIPGILGHSDIIQYQKEHYEATKSFLKTIPLHFIGIIIVFISSYFLTEYFGSIVRMFVVLFISFFYWKIYIFPKERNALTWSIWISCWCIAGSFVLKAFWQDGFIHASHAFFLTGIVLLTLLIATRVLVSHGPRDKRLENSKILYAVSFLLILTAATRVSAFLMPDQYYQHLAYSSFVLVIAVVLWSWRYLRYAFSKLPTLT